MAFVSLSEEVGEIGGYQKNSEACFSLEVAGPAIYQLQKAAVWNVDQSERANDRSCHDKRSTDKLAPNILLPSSTWFEPGLGSVGFQALCLLHTEYELA